jgi:hypothetical protein
VGPLCACGEPAIANIQVEAEPIVSNDRPYGRHVCLRCLALHRAYKAEQLAEWLSYFEPAEKDKSRTNR